MKNAKKFITLNNKIEKLEKEIKKYELGIKTDFTKLNDLQERINKLREEQFTFEIDILTLEDKIFINEYYLCEIFEI